MAPASTAAAARTPITPATRISRNAPLPCELIMSAPTPLPGPAPDKGIHALDLLTSRLCSEFMLARVAGSAYANICKVIEQTLRASFICKLVYSRSLFMISSITGVILHCFISELGHCYLHMCPITPPETKGLREILNLNPYRQGALGLMPGIYVRSGK